jgi:hypothetical protein
MSSWPLQRLAESARCWSLPQHQPAHVCEPALSEVVRPGQVATKPGTSGGSLYWEWFINWWVSRVVGYEKCALDPLNIVTWVMFTQEWYRWSDRNCGSKFQ